MLSIRNMSVQNMPFVTNSPGELSKRMVSSIQIMIIKLLHIFWGMMAFSKYSLQGPSRPRILGRSDFSLQDNKGEVTVR